MRSLTTISFWDEDKDNNLTQVKFFNGLLIGLAADEKKRKERLDSDSLNQMQLVPVKH